MAGGNGHGFFLDPGGMFRCCVEHLEDLHEQGTIPTTLGTEIQCEYCKGDLRLNTEGVWEWIAVKTKSQDGPISS
jgi:hypothetical protein